MKYAHRFIYSFLLSLFMLIGFIYFDIAPHYLELKSLEQSRIALLGKWQSMEKLEKLKRPQVFIKTNSKAKLDALSTIGAIMRAKGLTVQLAELNPSKSELQSLHFVVEGPYSGLVAMVNALPRHEFLSAITHFSLKHLNQTTLTISLDLIVLQGYHRLFSPINEPASLGNPFCLNEHSFMPASSLMNMHAQSVLSSTPLSNFKMVGYLHQGQKTRGFVSANNTTMEVSPYALLGSEKAKVKTIFSDHMLVMLPNKKEFALTMKRGME